MFLGILVFIEFACQSRCTRCIHVANVAKDRPASPGMVVGLYLSNILVDCSTRSHLLVSLPSENKRGLDFPIWENPALLGCNRQRPIDLSFADSEHLRAARGTNALSCRLPILHCYRLSIFHFLLGAALYTIRLHLFSSLLYL